MEVWDDFDSSKVEPGVYFVRKKHDQYIMRVVVPRTKQDREAYRLGQERDIITAVIDRTILPDQFADVRITSADSGGASFQPPIYQEDDALNMLVKTGIRLKDAPFEPYGKRMAAMAVDKYKGIEGTNMRNNARRSFRVNHTMSATKALQYSDTFEMQLAYIIADQPGAMHPMFPDDPGAALVIYPSGIPFKIDSTKLIDASELVRIGIADTKNIEESDKEDEDD